MRALIVDPWDGRATLAAVRALGAAGWHVGVGAPRPRTLSTASRWCTYWDPVPSLEQGLDAFVDAVNGAVSRRGYDVVFSSSDGEVLALSHARERIDARVPYASDEVVARAFDKLCLAEAATRVGIASPAMALAGDPIAERLSQRPVVVKERTHGALAVHGRPARAEVAICHSPVQVAARLAALNGTALIQELVEGRLGAFTVVVDRDGDVLARVQQRAERTWPATAGCSVRARTVAIDEELATKVGALMAELGWFGLAQLQFMEPEGAEPLLIDFNGRFYGSMSLALGAGVNLPALWASLATGDRPTGRHDGRPGVRYQYLEGDLQVARAERRGGLGRDLASCLRYAVGARHSILSARDPRPGLRASLGLLGEAAQVLRHRLPGARRGP
ncbi:MAG TPA: ATP-grasp domain-containing protein [Solirubrobacteraceae bacterium]|nr:ATP-grasp domain-containing protein [Solirubrobacteraceae bacterium]